MSRKIIKNLKWSQPKSEDAKDDPIVEINGKALSGQYLYLLAYADDGVIWGVMDKDSGLTLSDTAFPDISPKLRKETLWEVRLFSENAEWYLWKTDQGWRWREITDGAGEKIEAFDEDYILWGTDPEESKPPFTLVREADMGIRHAPPKPLNGRHSLKLRVRHYLDYDDTGVVFVKYSRLVELLNGDEK